MRKRFDQEVLCRKTISVEIVIRPCVEGDLPALEWMGLYTHHRDVIRQAFEAQQRGDALLLLAVAADFPVGQVWIDFARKREDSIAFLWAVRTFYPLQGAGIGSDLMNTAEAILRARSIGRAELGVERGNTRGLRFYERLGWRIVEPLCETFSYSGSDGMPVSERLEQWLLAKDLSRLARRA